MLSRNGFQSLTLFISDFIIFCLWMFLCLCLCAFEFECVCLCVHSTLKSIRALNVQCRGDNEVTALGKVPNLLILAAGAPLITEFSFIYLLKYKGNLSIFCCHCSVIFLVYYCWQSISLFTDDFLGFTQTSVGKVMEKKNRAKKKNDYRYYIHIFKFLCA